jgi:homoserine dehydrogenase
MSLGYTEPDPVADLSGVDVARKALILARLAGLANGSMNVSLQGLVDPDWMGLEREELLERIRGLDSDMAARVQAAASAGKVLRYVARVDANGIWVGTEAVAKDSPFGGLSGSDNMIVFHSARYADRPLVVTGPGAGIDVTAMGVLGDIFRVAAERR